VLYGKTLNARAIRLAALPALLVACSSTPGSTTTLEVDASHATADAESNDPRCPEQWADLTDSSGIPTVCTVDGLICVYPQGQGECSPDGTVLKWWQDGSGQGCSEYPPTVGASCNAPGNVCGYISGPPSSSNFVTSYCCDGTSTRWELDPDEGCPNGNTCGTIMASDYDQTCTTASDCVGVSEGNFCEAICACNNAVINVSAQTQYETDLAKKENTPKVCPCPSGQSPVCDAGVCGLGSTIGVPAGDAG
jgi:hypothetical protein